MLDELSFSSMVVLNTLAKHNSMTNEFKRDLEFFV